jgi:hypothetical protein
VLAISDKGGVWLYGRQCQMMRMSATPPKQKSPAGSFITAIERLPVA